MVDGLHFLYPWWFAALLPLVVGLWWLARSRPAANPWAGVIDPRLLELLLVEGEARVRRLPLWLLGVGWLAAVIVLAGPVWEKQPQPVFKRQDPLVVVLDLSRSMATPDLRPSRMERARYKLKALLRQRKEGQTGLVVFAGDAFVVTPLTDDTATIDAQLHPLAPELMPAQGSRVDLGLRKAGELLHQAGARHGRILVVGDGFEGASALREARALRAQGYQVSVLGVGTPLGAPLPDGQGGFLRDTAGRVVTPILDESQLRALAAAGGGRYLHIATDDSDVRALSRSESPVLDDRLRETEQQSPRWKERAPLLLLALLPLSALAFRRGWLLSVALVLFTLPAPRPASAFGWRDLWQRPEQQAAEALAAGDAQRALQLARDPLRRGSAAYRSGDYAQALNDFSTAKGGEAAYDRGNALARLGRYQEAVSAYDQALEQHPEMEDARYNKALVEQLLEQQQSQQSQQAGKSQEGKPQQNQGGQGQQAQDDAGGQSSSGEQQQQAAGEQGDQGKSNESAQGQRQQGVDDERQGSQGQQNQAGESQQGQAAQAEQNQQEPNQAAQAQPQQAAGEQGKQGEAKQGAEAQRQEATEERDQQGSQRQQTQGSESQQAQQKKAEEQAATEPQQGQGPAGPEQGGKKAESETATAQVKPEGDGKNPFAEAVKQLEQKQKNPESLAAGQASGTPGGKPSPPRQGASIQQAQALDTEERQAAEQWLRRIPDDPGGLLRRKFLYQYRQRGAAAGTAGQHPW